MRKKKDKGPDANYEFDSRQPQRPMGLGSFANMPEHPIYMSFSSKPDYRDGIVNKFTDSVEEVSGIDENEC